MVIDRNEKRIARAMWGVAAGVVEHRDPEARAVSRAALERPCPETILALLEFGKGRPWINSVLDALVQCGIAASEDILGDDNE